MNLNDKISHLIKHGLSPSFVMKLNESVINEMYGRLMEKKNEPTEAVTTKITTEKVITMTQNDAKNQGVNVDGVNVSMDNAGMISVKQTKPTTETANPEEKQVVKKDKKSEVDEKFESKSQQKYFYSRCKDKKLTEKERKKWCKMADEFSSDTNFKKLPEKVSKKDKLEENIYNFVVNATLPPISKRDLLKIISETKK
jgi:hypothetical protein